MNHSQQVRLLASRYGVEFMPGIAGMLNRDAYGANFSHAMDAQPTLVTTPNGGIPAYLTNYLDPELVAVLVSPMQIEELIGSAKKGDWTTLTAQFRVRESVGSTSSYDDYSNTGNAASNNNWISRQSYHFQTITQWGERELAIAGEGRIDLAADLNIASALVINKFANKIGFFGVANLQNYGLLNDPQLPATISPNPTGTGSGTTWATKDGSGVYGDIVSLYTQLVTQTKGLVNRKTPMTLGLSPESEANFTKTNQYNVNVSDQLAKNFPNLKVVTAVEYATTGGELVQLIADSLEGTKTAQSCFTEKMRAHPVIADVSSWKQKKSAGSWGAINKRPYCIAGMLGV